MPCWSANILSSVRSTAAFAEALRQLCNYCFDNFDLPALMRQRAMDVQASICAVIQRSFSVSQHGEGEGGPTCVGIRRMRTINTRIHRSQQADGKARARKKEARCSC